MKTTLFLLFLLSFQLIFAQLDSLLLPTSQNQTRELIKHTYYQLGYDEANEQAAWVFYLLTPEIIQGTAKRKNRFKADKLVETGSAELIDYKGSGYDRGHLCPAGAMKINQQAMDESFYMSNMSPQLPGFNRGKWKQLESQVRKWVLEEDSLYVVSGGVFSDSLGSIGPNKVTVPSYFYKVIYDPTAKEKMIAFILPNKKLEKDLSEYMVTVDEVELKTGLDFFPGLPDHLETKLESTVVKW